MKAGSQLFRKDAGKAGMAQGDGGALAALPAAWGLELGLLPPAAAAGVAAAGVLFSPVRVRVWVCGGRVGARVAAW